MDGWHVLLSIFAFTALFLASLWRRKARSWRGCHGDVQRLAHEWRDNAATWESTARLNAETAQAWRTQALEARRRLDLANDALFHQKGRARYLALLRYEHDQVAAPRLPALEDLDAPPTEGP